jgi:hypothetical protein
MGAGGRAGLRGAAAWRSGTIEAMTHSILIWSDYI